MTKAATAKLKSVAAEANPLTRRLDFGAIWSALTLIAVAILIEPALADGIVDAFANAESTGDLIKNLIAAASAIYLVVTRPKPEAPAQ